MRPLWKCHVWLALVLLPLLTNGRLLAQEKDPPEVKLPALCNYKPLKVDPKDDEFKRLAVARYNEAITELQVLSRRVEAGAIDFTMLFYPGQNVFQAAQEVFEKPADRLTLHNDYLELTKEVEKIYEAQYQFGKIGKLPLNRARYNRIDAEIELLRYKRAAEKAKDK
jgi:hypothetical protein